MAESTLTLTYWDAVDEVSDFLGQGRGHTNENNLARVRDILEAGYRQYLFPPPTPMGRVMRSHKWSFLSPTATLTLRANKESGTLSGTASTTTFTDSAAEFQSYGVLAGDTLTITAGAADAGTYTVETVDSETQVTLTATAGTGNATYTLGAGASQYPLPDDFGGLIGVPTYGLDIEDVPLQHCHEGQIRQWYAESDWSSDPTHCAVRVKSFTRETGQRWEILFWPRPDTARTLTYRYNVLIGKWGHVRSSGTCTAYTDSTKTLDHTNATFQTDGVTAGDKVVISSVDTDQTAGIYEVASVTDEDTFVLTTAIGADDAVAYEVLPANLYPLGGMPHADTLLESCYSIAEERRDDGPGIHTMKWKERLVTSVDHDRSLGPRRLGPFTEVHDDFRGRDRFDPVSYNGNAP